MNSYWSNTFGIFAALWSVGCAGPEPAVPLVAEPAPEPVAVNLYNLDVRAEDHLGNVVGLDMFRGKPVIVSMVYSSCASACPRQLFDVQRTEMLIPDDAKAALRVLAVSFDPERDTPEVLAALADSHQVDLERWRFLRPSATDAKRIADAMNITYTKLDDGTWNHDSVMVLLEPNGEIGVQVYGLGQDTMPIVERVTELARTR